MEEVARSIQQQLKIEDASGQGALEPFTANIPKSPSIPRDFDGTGAVDDEGNDAAEDVMLDREPSSIALCRKVLPTLNDDDAVCCSICLDDFTQEDPAVNTACAHGYHLQCIMQWAQRSRECPLCFHTLQLEDEVMNSLLPFGEYINPQQTAATAALLENWEMERFLVSLAVTEQRERRAARSSRRRSHPHGGEISAPRPIVGGGVRGRTEPQEISPLSGNGGASSLPGRDQNNSLGGEYPSSWPPSRQDGSQEGSSSQMEGLSQAIKSKWASLRFRESLNKTTKELKSLFGSTAASSSNNRSTES
ncbi:hypothetical protein Ndes2437B_g05889 [Nannochloris sp. 'desiccata']|nr:hypothetical protein KSW81_007852 [Chlorella desiccata (nom. nud.)]